MSEHLRPQNDLSEMLSGNVFEGLTAEGRLQAIAQMSPQACMDTLSAIHAAVAPHLPHEPSTKQAELVDYATKEVIGHLASPEDRPLIMAHALKMSQLIAWRYSRDGGSLDNALERCKNLMGFAVVLSHWFEDGNGGTARVFGELIYSGFDPADTEQMEHLAKLGANRSDGADRIDSYVPAGVWANGNADTDPIGFLDAVTRLDVPFDPASYQVATKPVFTVPPSITSPG